MSSYEVKENREKVEFRHEENELILAEILAILLLIFVGNMISFIFTQKFDIIIMSLLGLVIILVAFILDVIRTLNYSIKVEGNTLIYKSREKESYIQLPTLIIQMQKGIISSNGNQTIQYKIRLGGLEFDASDTDKNGKTILEFLEEVNQKAIETSQKDGNTI